MTKIPGRFLVIAERGAVVRELPADDALDVMQREVGGYIELFMRAASASRPGVTIDFWCNEEGRLAMMPFNALVDAGDGRVFDIVGPVLITAGNDEGEVLGLTDDEFAAVEIVRPTPFRPAPVVKYNG